MSRKYEVSERHFDGVPDPGLKIDPEIESPDIDKIEQRLLLTLDRVSIHLAKNIAIRPLDGDELMALTQTLRLVKDLKNKANKELEALSDDELKAIIQKEQK